MDVEGLTMAEKCENMMNVVVESRKRFGKKCIDYEHKTSLMENMILNVTVETFSKHKVKSKKPLSNIDIKDVRKDIDEFAAEILKTDSRIQNLKEKLKDIDSIVQQMKQDTTTKKLKRPIDAKHMFTQASKQRIIEKNCD